MAYAEPDKIDLAWLEMVEKANHTHMRCGWDHRFSGRQTAELVRLAKIGLLAEGRAGRQETGGQHEPDRA